jgi:putative ABC transport system permease protein
MTLDLWYAVRRLRKDPWITSAILLILAVGIGANTAVFSIVDAALLRPSPYAAADRLVRVSESSTARNLSGVPVNDYQRWSERSDIFERIAPYLRDTVTLTGDGEPDQVIAVRSLGMFPLLGVRAKLGRTLLPSDDEGPRDIAVLSDRLWRRRYQADPNVIGRGITISGEPYTIAGVMAPDFEFRYPEAELWTPLRITAVTPWFQVAARLRPGIAAAQAQKALEIVARDMEREQPKDRAGFQILVTPWNGLPEEKYKLTLILALASVGLVMLIACADAGSLLLGRAVQRQKEIAIRASLGAGLWRVARQLLSESLVLAVLASAAGIAVAGSVLDLLTTQLAALPIALPHLQSVSLNGRVFAFTAALCLVLTAVCSLAPILLAARTDLQAALRGGSVGAGPRGASRLFASLVAVEAGLAFLLLAGSGLMIRSLLRLQQEDRGLRPDHVLTLRVPVGTLTQPRPTGKYDTRARQMAYYRDILARVKTVPGIKAAAIVNNPPLSGINSTIGYTLGGQGSTSELTSTRTISPQYFAAMGIPFVAGRDFTAEDRAGAPAVVIINEYLARQVFAGRSPVGQQLWESGARGPGPTVVGVVRDTPQLKYEEPAKGEVYIPYQQFMFATFMSTIVVRTEGEPTAMAATLRKEVWAVDPDQPVVKVETMEEVIANAIWRPRFSAWIFSVLSGLSLLLTAIGVYAVVAYTTARRAREVGIRIALGARSSDILALMLRGALLPVVAGLAVSLVVTVLLSRFLTSVLYGISSTDPMTYLGAVALLLTIGAAASARPAWRAARQDPLRTLRAE